MATQLTSTADTDRAEYWKQYLADPNPCNFPTLTDSIDTDTHLGQLPIEVADSDIISRLHSFCAQHGFALQTVILATWSFVLRTYTGSGAISLGAIRCARDRDSVGVFTASLDDEQSILDILQAVERDFARSAPYLGQTFSEIASFRGQDGRPLCNTAIQFDTQSDNGEQPFQEFDVILNVRASQNGLEASLFYSDVRLSDAHAVNVAATFRQTLSEVLSDPSRSYAQIQLVHPQTLGRIFEWNSHYPPPVDECVGKMFQAQVQSHPNNQAVHSSDDSFTYDELSALSTKLARHLQSRGVCPESVVLLCFPKSAWAVVAMMAVIQAGGTMLFFDASHPTARLQEIQSQVNSKFILSAPQYQDMWDWTGAELFVVDRLFVTELPSKDQVSETTVSPSNMLYIIFTSGSTGKPKGCVIEHRQFLTGSLAQQRESGMVHTDRVLQLASFTFDVSILEIVTSLITGACVCIPGDEARSKGPASCIQEFGITWAFLTPSLVKLMTPEMVPNLRFLVLGGEALSKENVETWAPHLQLANGYGPTEASIAATGNRKLEITTDPLNIGKPLGAVCWIVDPENHKRLVPIGAPGEMLIQGPIVARGYFNDPIKTEAAFVDDFPWLPKDGHPRRMYKTGDLARYNADGTLNFISRKDSQVKLRGLRIELGEIEHNIAVHPLVQQAVVLLPRQGPCKNQLTAVVTLKDFHNSESSGLQLVSQDDAEAVSKTVAAVAEEISKHLPAYMLPTVWPVVQSIPLTTSSKQNRVMVAKWVVEMDDATYASISSIDDAEGAQEASTPMESQLQQLCSIVLGVNADRIRLNRSFVNNGGDSILAMQLMGRWRLEGVAVSIQDVLRSKTLSELAEHAGAAAEDFDGSVEYDMDKLITERLPELQLSAEQVDEAYPLSSMQRGMLLSQQRQSDSYELSITCEVIVPNGHILEKNRLKDAWEAVVRRHTSLRTIFVDSITEDGLFDQVVLKSPQLSVSEIMCEDEQNYLETAHRNGVPISTTQPPVNFTICETPAGRVFCTVTISHALIDGISVLLLFRDISLAYSQLLQADSPMRYSRYIGYLQAQSSESALEYWKEYLAGLAPSHFPVLNDDIKTSNELHELSMDIDDLSDMTSFCQTYNLTPASVFQTAWALVLKAYTGLDDVCFGYLSSGRDAPLANIGDTIGVYINMLICRLTLVPGGNVAQLVEDVQTSFLNAMPNQHCSLAEIQHGLQIQERLFNTVMSLQSVLGEVIRGEESSDSLGFKIIGEHDPTEYDISVNIATHKEGARVNIRYYTSFLSDKMATNVFETFKRAIVCVLDNTQTTVSDLKLLSQRDETQIHGWNSQRWEDVDACVHHRVTEQVKLRPNATAVQAWDGSLTYQELEDTSAKLAQHLKSLGTESGVLIAMCFDKSLLTVVSQLAVLKAGGACVAFDPTHPQVRRQELLRQCDASIAVVAPQHEHLFRALVSNVVVIQESFLDQLPPIGVSATATSKETPSDPAFVVFTSGSTGKPKGIVLEHHALSTSSMAHGPAMNYGPDARILQFAAYTFDVSIGETFTCLTSGGTLCIPSDDERMNDLAGAINRMNVNIAYLTPSVASILHPSEVPGLRTLALGGEAVRAENISFWADKVHLVNIYGPAEASVWSTGLGPVPSGTSPANIGFGLGALQWITEIGNPNKLVAVGTIGELLIEGPIVARGYLKDKEKTDAAFISDPDWLPLDPAIGSRRMYRTGDLARFNSDGSVNFVGRRDNQIKLHGQRIELGEIEHNLLAYESIRNAVVVLPKVGVSKERLCGVISLKSFTVQGASDAEIKLVDPSKKEAVAEQVAVVREYLSERVPPYMMPAVWLVVESIPLSVNGKTDRSRITKWAETVEKTEDGSSEVKKTALAVPKTQAEEELQAILSLVLNMPADQISMDQSFLSLGGDSITAMQVSARCRSRSMLVTVRDILRSKTIGQLASTAKVSDQNSNLMNREKKDGPFQLLSNSNYQYLDDAAKGMGLSGLSDLEDAYPCSPMQQGILISQAQASAAYKFFVICEVVGTERNVDISFERLKVAWQRVVGRHASLRTIFIESVSKEGLYDQVVLKKFTPRIEEVKDFEALRKYPESNPVNYEERTPPHRLTICKGKDKAYFNLEISHTLIDGGSMAVILRDMAAAYESELPVGPLYRDYISVLQEQNAPASLAYWKKYLSDVEPCSFPLLNDVAEEGKELRTVTVTIPETTRQKLQTFSEENGVTLANIFQLTWGLVLRTYTSSTDVLFGYLASGRDIPVSDIENAVGAFINMLVCRVDAENSTQIVESVQKIQDDYLECLPHQHTPLAEIQHAMDFSGKSMFNTILSLQRPMADGIEKNGEIAINYLSGSDPTEYSLSVNVIASDKMVEASISYWTTVLSKEQAERVAAIFSTALTSLLAKPQSKIGELDLLGPGQREQVFAWNRDGVVPDTVDTCIHDLVERQAKNQPKAPAISSWDGEFSFAELNDLATRLAHHLEELGVGPEVKVPIVFDKSAWTIVSMVAILKAGGAYVSMDPSHPKQHLANIIQQTGANIVLAGSIEYAEKLTGVVGQIVVVKPSLFRNLSNASPQLSAKISPSNAAFVCFTSGSTGKPKGAVLKHSGFCSMVANNTEMGITASSRVFQFAAYTFDTSNSEIFTTLVSGGCVCIPSEDERINDPAGAINRLRVNWTFLTPSMAGLLSPKDVPTLKTLALGGEQVREDIVSKWKDQALVINSYGPMEATIWTSMAYLGRGNSPATIGRGNGSLLWVVDSADDQRLAPIGGIGELLIEGPILARGYLDDEKTQAAFIKAPSWRGPVSSETRLYKSGDLVRYHKDGTLIYIGRKDSQVKLNGQRIEMGEIERHVAGNTLIQYAVVLLPKSGLCKRRLVAVVAPSEFASNSAAGSDLRVISGKDERIKAASQVAEVREQLSAQVPGYMVPSIWLMAESFPLTASKKVDRVKISRWVEDMDSQTYSMASDVDEEEYVEDDVTPKDKKLQRVISLVLNLPEEQVRLSKSFLNLGGDSILAMQLIVQCRREGMRITVKDVMRSKTISGLALCAEETENATLSKEEVFEIPFELSPVQQMYFDEISHGSNNPNENQFNQSFLLRPTRALGPQDLAKAIDSVVQQHSMLRARFRKDSSGHWTQLVLKPQAVNSYRFRVHDVESREVALALAETSQGQLDIENGPVFAVELFNILGQDQLLFLVAHHLVIDLVSWRVILRQVEEALQSGSSDSDAPLPFQTWTKMQAGYASQNLEPSVALPYSVPEANYKFWGMDDTANLRNDTEEVTFSMGREDTKALLKGCHEALRTEPLDIFLSALFQSFTQTFRRSPPAVFNEGHGREPWDSQIDISETVGWFTTMFPLYVPTEQSSNFLDTIRRTKDHRAQLPRNGWPYFASRFLHEDGKKAFARHTPIEILFNYLGGFQGMESADAMFRIEPFNKGDVGPSVRRFALFEINVYVVDGTARYSFVFNKRMQHQELIRKWIATYEMMLMEAVEILQKTERTLTLSDFPLLPVSFPALEKFQRETLPQLGISKDNVEDMYACSPMQEGILLSQTRLSGAYQVETMVEIVSSAGKKIDVQRLQAAWQHVIDRQASLRTVFVQQLTTRPFDQIVLRNFTGNSSVLSGEDEEIVEKLKAVEGAGHYRPGHPPHHFTLAQSTRNGKVFCKLEISHALIDGTSMAILMSELALAYQGQLSTGAGPLYSDYISYLQSQTAGKALSFWTEHLADVKPCHFPLLIDNNIQSEKQLRSINIEVPDYAQVREFCQKNSITLANVFRLAWGLVLRAYTGDDQICFGYLTSGREVPVPGVEDAVGAFINMLVCSLDFAQMDDKAALQGLDELQEEYLKVLPWQYASLAEIQHELGLAGQILFNTVLSFQRRAVDNIGVGDILFKYLGGEDPTEYAASINVAESQDGIHVVMSYLTDRISEGQAANVAGTLSTALSAIIRAPKSKISSLDLFGERDCQQVLAWNKNCPATIDECVHEIFQRNARDHPEAPAIASWDADFTYAQLDKVTTQLAHRLVKLGVGPDVLVPILFEKSSWAIVAMLGINKAGGAWVPLDPSHPTSRHENLISQTGARLALASEKQSHRLTQLADRVVVVSESTDIWQDNILGEVQSSVTPSNAAYTLFTSGSTGTPKGVLLDHSAVSSSIIHHGAQMGCSKATRMFQFAAYTFDACIMEIFTALAYGGCICIPSDEERMSNIAGFITRMQVNTSFMTPSVVRIIRPEQVPTLMTLVLGGEALGQDNLDTWTDKLRLMNGYGPTEACVFCVMKTFEKKSERNDILGRAVSSLSWIVRPDNHNQLAPVGSVGMLLVQGPTLARGYLNDEAKTASVFIEDPAFLPNVPGVKTRLYNTGDQARYNSDGTITYLGRRDTQVKLRGQRIELAEIEHQTKTHFPAASQVGVEVILPGGEKQKATLAVFICLGDDAQEKSLFVPISDILKPQLLDLQKMLDTVLPPYMIPSLYIPVGRMPTTTAGKLDRMVLRDTAARLSDAQLNAYSLQDGHKRAPGTDMEKKLADAWHEVLKISLEQIGADDSFFRLGGDSIMAMRLAAASTADMSISVADIFRHPVLSEMAALAENTVTETEVSDLDAFDLLTRWTGLNDIKKEAAAKCGIEENQIEDAYPCTPLQEGLVTLSIIRPGAYMAQKIFKLPEAMDMKRFRGAWEAVIAMHPILRTSIVQTETAGALQVVVRGHTWRTAGTLEEYLALDKKEEVAYGDPLSRYAITEDLHFVWTAHHAIYDGWMVPLVLEQVRHAYESGKAFEAPGFNHFIKYLAATDLQASGNYWRDQFLGERPTAFPEAPPASHKLHVNRESHHSIQIQRKQGSGILMSTILRTAWAIVLANYSDSQDVVFGVTLSGRNCPVPGIAKMLGPTITTVPVRVQIHPGTPMTQFLEEIQRQATEMIPHEHFGLQNISRLSPEAARAVEFQNLFVVQPLSQFDVHGHELLGAIEVPIHMEDFDTYPLIMECSLSNDRVDLEARYDGAIISNEQMQTMLHHFEYVVRQVNDEASDITVDKIDMFSERDKAQILGWNNAYPEVVEAIVPDIFAQQVRKRPGARAIDSWDGQFTYADLDTLSTKLAHYLVKIGLGPEQLVPHCFDKSKWAVVAQMAVLKAGAGVVNLDPKHPLSRMELIIQDAEAKVILVSPQHANIFGADGPKVVVVNEEFLNKLPASSNSKLPHIDPRNTAYVLFTSGSTGKPKGIVIEHGSLCTSSQAHGTRWDIGPNTRLLQFAAYTFDVSCADIFTTLQRGGCICIPSENDRINNLAGAINKFKANWVFLTPTVASLLPADGMPTLKKLVLGGEASTRDTIKKWHNVLDLIVCYGPAECSVYCSGAPPATATSDPADLGPAIGALYWIADPLDHNRLVPVGCSGELLLEGRTVAREYLHDKEKTAGAFIQNPAWATGGTKAKPRRFYKTGDIVRYNTDGTIHFVGRKDTQVKVRGQRVELGEIEFAIRENLPTIGHVTVDAVRLESQGGRQAVVAFLHTTTESGDAKALPMDDRLREQMNSLQRALSESLPSYMIPSMFVPMLQVPLNMNGKTDRRRLRDLATSFSREEALTYSLQDSIKQEPTTEMEFKLRDLWARTLGVDAQTIGVGDQFFRLGGDSILAMKLVGAATEQGIALSVRDFFTTPVLAEMASQASNRSQHLTNGKTLYQPFSLIGVTPLKNFVADVSSQIGTAKENIEDVLPATDFQQNAVAHALLRTRGFLNYLFLDGKPDQPMNLELAKRSCQQLVQEHQILRTVFAFYEDKFVQVVLKNSKVDFTIHEIDGDIADFSSELCKRDVKADLRLGNSLVKFMIVRNKKGTQHRIIMRVSHAQYDGVCLPRIWKSLEDAFAEKTDTSGGEPFSKYVAAAATVNNVESHQYWKTLLKGSSMTNVVAHSKPEYRNIYNSVTKRTIPNVSLSSRGITFATILKTAWAIVLASLSGKDDVTFGHVVSGRNIENAAVETAVGPCLNIIPVRVNVMATRESGGLLSQVQDQHAASISYESLGSREIIRNCTSWPKYTRFSSIVQHQNIEEATSLTLAGTKNTVGFFCPEADEADVAVKSTPLGDTIQVELISSSTSVGPKMANLLVDRLCEEIQRIGRSPEKPPNLNPRGKTVLPLQPPSQISNGVIGPNGTNGVNGVSIKSRIIGWEGLEKKGIIEKMVRTSWQNVLGSTELKFDSETDFFEVGGDLVSAAVLAAMWQKAGYKITLEGVIDHSEFQGMVRMLSRS